MIYITYIIDNNSLLYITSSKGERKVNLNNKLNIKFSFFTPLLATTSYYFILYFKKKKNNKSNIK